MNNTHACIAFRNYLCCDNFGGGHLISFVLFFFFLVMQATIPYGSPSEFIVTGSSGVDHLLKVDNSSDVSW